MRRRTFLWTLGAAALALRSRARAAAAGDVRFLVVFLRGGYDGASVLVPWSSPFYYECRPAIAIPRPDGGDPRAAARLDPDWALHPALRSSLLPLWERGQVAFVPFAGTPDLSRSHFETQAVIESGEPPDQPEREYGSGFLNRLVEQLGGAGHPIAFTDGLPLAMSGPVLVPNLSLKQMGKPAFDERQSAILADMYRGTALEDQVAQGLALRRDAERDLAREQAQAAGLAASPKGFELEARRIAAMMRERFDVAFTDVAGWDTHVNQPGSLAGSLENLGAGLAAFAEAMGSAWARTVVVVISEFGRTFRENGTRGTDHGHGNVLWVLGGAVRGGRVAGLRVAVDRPALLQDRDLPVLNDWRDVLGGLFRRLWDLDDARLARVFPRSRPVDLGLL